MTRGIRSKQLPSGVEKPPLNKPACCANEVPAHWTDMQHLGSAAGFPMVPICAQKTNPIGNWELLLLIVFKGRTQDYCTRTSGQKSGESLSQRRVFYQ